MSKDKPIKNNIKKFIKDCSDIVGDNAKANFYLNMNEECSEYVCHEDGFTSPIEQVFYVAINTVMKISNIPCADQIDTISGSYLYGIAIFPQVEIGKYRVDFKVSFHIPKYKGKEYRKSVIVECDSQSFHERTENERRYEKSRDRYFNSKGYTVFHFTGKEILCEPFRVASEVLAYVIPFGKQDPRSYVDPETDEFALLRVDINERS